MDFDEHQAQQLSLEKYHDFLLNVCRNKEIASDEQTGENEIKMLRDRFVNLKTESKKLKQRKQQINEETEAVRKNEKERLA